MKKHTTRPVHSLPERFTASVNNDLVKRANKRSNTVFTGNLNRSFSSVAHASYRVSYRISYHVSHLFSTALTRRLYSVIVCSLLFCFSLSVSHAAASTNTNTDANTDTSNNANNTNTSTKTKDAISHLTWQNLTSPTNVKRWYTVNKAADEPAAFTIKNNHIVGDTRIVGPSKQRQWFVYPDVFDDFILTLEFHANDTPPANSGVHFRSRFVDDADLMKKTRLKAPIMQGPLVATDSGQLYKNGLVWNAAAKESSWLPALPRGVRPSPELAPENLTIYTKPETWNKLVLIVKASEVRIIMNGVILNQFNGEVAWQNPLHKLLNVGLSGQFAFELDKKKPAHFIYKNIKVAPLRASDHKLNDIQLLTERYIQ